MKNRLISFLLLAVLCLSLLAACGNDSVPITEKTAISIALKDAGLSENQVEELHAHVAAGAESPSYSIHFDYNGRQYEYVIDARNGDILSVTDPE